MLPLQRGHQDSVSSSSSGSSNERTPLLGSSTAYSGAVSVDSSLAYNSTYEERISLLRNEPAVRVIPPEVNVEPAGKMIFFFMFQLSSLSVSMNIFMIYLTFLSNIAFFVS